MRRTAAPIEYARRVDWQAVWTWLLYFGLVVYLGLKGGGYDPLVHDQAGVAVLWILLAAVLAGAVPRRSLGRLGWSALGLLALFALWTALSLAWTESTERTWADLARVVTYLAVLGLALFTYGPRERERVICALASGIVFVGVVALLSRLHPAWFPAARETARFLSSGRERLSYPLNYWNGLAALLAMGLPLVLYMATSARSVVGRALGAAALPAIALTLFFTLSRGGIAAAALVVVVFLLFAADRFPKVLTLLVGGGGGAILIATALHRDALQNGFLNPTAREQGNEVMWIALVVCVAAGALQAAITVLSRTAERPRWTVIGRRQARAAAAACVLLLLAVGVALGAPGRVSDGWAEFKRGGSPGKGTQRLSSAAGQNRYQYWVTATEENATKPLTGTGSGTFEYWWLRNGTTTDTIRDTHSLYLQTLGELGIVGLALILAFLVVGLVGGGVAAVRAGPAERTALAAALAGVFGFYLTAVVDWMWQLPVLAVCMLLLTSLLVAPSWVGDSVDAGADSGATRGTHPFAVPLRLCFAVCSIVAIVVIAIPLASTSLLRQSQADARSGDLPAALAAARSAQNVQPGAASPRLEEALVLEMQGRLAEAAEAAEAATARESTNWRTWVVLSRLEAERGRATAAVQAYRRARSLNPRSSLFDR